MHLKKCPFCKPSKNSLLVLEDCTYVVKKLSLILKFSTFILNLEKKNKNRKIKYSCLNFHHQIGEKDVVLLCALVSTLALWWSLQNRLINGYHLLSEPFQTALLRMWKNAELSECGEFLIRHHHGTVHKIGQVAFSTSGTMPIGKRASCEKGINRHQIRDFSGKVLFYFRCL